MFLTPFQFAAVGATLLQGNKIAYEQLEALREQKRQTLIRSEIALKELETLRKIEEQNRGAEQQSREALRRSRQIELEALQEQERQTLIRNEIVLKELETLRKIEEQNREILRRIEEQNNEINRARTSQSSVEQRVTIQSVPEKAWRLHVAGVSKTRAKRVVKAVNEWTVVAQLTPEEVIVRISEEFQVQLSRHDAVNLLENAARHSRTFQ